jgi:hypothetical protein
LCNGLYFDANPIYPVQVVTIDASGSVWASGNLLFGGDIVATGNPVQYGTSFVSTGIYTFIFTLNNPLSGTVIANCSGDITVIESPITGLCNTSIV